MAERTKIPMSKDVDGPDPPVEATAIDRAVPQRPARMQAPQGKVAQRRLRDTSLATPSSLKPKSAGDTTIDASLTRFQQIKKRLNSAAASAFGISLLLHVLMLLGMALWILPQLTDSPSVTTVVESDSEAPQPFDSLEDVQLELPAGQDNLLLPQLTDAVLPQDSQLNLLENQFLRDVTAAETQGEGGSTATGRSFHLLEPKNAVQAGSFTAWTIPIAERPAERVKAGVDPRPGQDYHIVIQVKVPGVRRVYSISDLSGRVIGTDGYVQVIPAQAYFQDEDGRLIRARLGSRLPVIDGVAQILVRVPGAEALVKDTILVKSQRLHEEQTLELVFGRTDRIDSP